MIMVAVMGQHFFPKFFKCHLMVVADGGEAQNVMHFCVCVVRCIRESFARPFLFFFLSSSIRVAVRADLQAYKAHVSLDRMKVLLILVSSQEGTPNDFSLLGR